jgi:predicted ABC-type ATPase
VAEADSGKPGSLYVLAGCNGAGKSSVGGAALRQSGADFFNPDHAAQRFAAAITRAPLPTQTAINALAWNEGRRLLERAIAEHGNFAFETTLGGDTMVKLIAQGAAAGLSVHVWFVGLERVELNIRRVRQRVKQGGHDIPIGKTRERYERAPLSLIRLLPHLTELWLYDNSSEADPWAGSMPMPRLLMHCQHGSIQAPGDLRTLLTDTPSWAKPIVAAALNLHLQKRHALRTP